MIDKTKYLLEVAAALRSPHASLDWASPDSRADRVCSIPADVGMHDRCGHSRTVDQRYGYRIFGINCHTLWDGHGPNAALDWTIDC